ncbi:hypothetical protein SFA35_22615 [Pseudomonas sp. HR96]|uniref:hypothetical protein n=1 Tax=Pseudomonas sp. HR96 TaxID=1027966 RepID=UPI002A75DCB4|nr:hypothetical protein [Pseudomonas sp. HR96]WPO99362.1 hypothetical protein SFA35_22615 [Pseudomonas sp. HR96]
MTAEQRYYSGVADSQPFIDRRVAAWLLLGLLMTGQAPINVILPSYAADRRPLGRPGIATQPWP